MNLSVHFFLLFILSTNLFVPNDLILHDPSTPEWVLEKEANGITVYTRTTVGANIKEFKAIMTTTQTMNTLEDLIEKVEDYPNWQENVTTSKLLKQLNPNEQYMHATTNIPWPIKDRDIVMHSKKTIQPNGIVTYTLKSKTEYLEKSDAFIRITDAKGFWEFAPKNEREIQITYQFYGDPAGNLPDWIINLFIVSGPYTTLMNIKNL